MVFTRGTLLGLALLLSACVTTPLAIDSTHPASIEAAEASSRPAQSTLQPDPTTRRTGELLAQRQQQAKAAEAEKPVDQSSIDQASPKPTAGHEHH